LPRILLLVLVWLATVIAASSLAQTPPPFEEAPGPEAPKPRPRPPASQPPAARPAAPSPATIAPEMAGPEAFYSRSAPSGAAAPVIRETAIDDNCAARPVDIRIVEPPQHGSATVRDEMLEIPARGRYGTNPAACAGRQVLGKRIYYQSNPGFRGADRVGYLFNIGGGEWHRFAVEITVE
jgi:hypothetical protein